MSEIELEGTNGDKCFLKKVGDRVCIDCKVNDVGAAFNISVKELKKVLRNEVVQREQ